MYEACSDILPFLIDIFTLVKDSPGILTSYYEKEIQEYYDDPIRKYDEIRNRFNDNHNALDFCLLSKTCYSGVIRFRKADGYMSTPRGPHNPIKPESFKKRVEQWHGLIQKADFRTERSRCSPYALISPRRWYFCFKYPSKLPYSLTVRQEMPNRSIMLSKMQMPCTTISARCG